MYIRKLLKFQQKLFQLFLQHWCSFIHRWTRNYVCVEVCKIIVNNEAGRFEGCQTFRKFYKIIYKSGSGFRFCRFFLWVLDASLPVPGCSAIYFAVP